MRPIRVRAHQVVETSGATRVAGRLLQVGQPVVDLAAVGDVHAEGTGRVPELRIGDRLGVPGGGPGLFGEQGALVEAAVEHQDLRQRPEHAGTLGGRLVGHQLDRRLQ